MEYLKQRAVAFLRRTETYTKTDMVYLAKGGSFLGIGQVVSSGAAFLLSIAFANLFPPEAYGEYKYILSVVGIAGAFALTGMDTAIIQAVARGFDGTLRTGFWIMFRYTLLTALITLCAAGYYFIHENTTLAWSLVIAALAMPLLKSSLLYNGFLLGKKEFLRKTRYGIFYDVLPALCIGTSLLFTHNALIVIAVYFSTYTLVAFLIYMRTKQFVPIEAPADPNITRYSLHLSAMSILGSISFQLDKVLTFHYLGAVQLAVYSFVIGVPQQLRQVQKIIGTLALTKFSEKTFAYIKIGIHRKALLLFFVMACVAGIYILCAPFLFELLFPKYIEAVRYSQLFSLILLFAPGMLYQQALTAHRNTKALYTIQIVGTPLRIALLFLLIPSYGILGIIVGMFVSEIVRLLIALYFIHTTKDTPFESVASLEPGLEE